MKSSEVYKEMLVSEILDDGDGNLTLRCKEDPRWKGCLAEFHIEEEGPMCINNKDFPNSVAPGNFVNIVATEGVARVINVLDYKPKAFRRKWS
jgi:hypothetical protein